MKGKPFKKLKRGAVVFGKDINAIIDLCNALLNGEITNGSKNDFLIGDLKILWQIKAAIAGSGSSSYRGEYEATGATTFGSGAFSFGDIVRVSPTNSVSRPMGGSVIAGVYICIQAAPSETDLPNHPLSPGGETAFWHWLATWPANRSVCDSDGTSTDNFIDGQPST